MKLLTIENRLYDALTASMKPVNLILSISALLACIIVLYEMHYPPVRVSDLLLLSTYLNGYVLAASFFGYAAASTYCTLSVTKTVASRRLRIAASALGIALWSVDFAAAMLHSSAGTELLRIMPICAEAWIMVQLTSNIHEQDRRKP